MSVKIIVDSGSDILPEEAEQMGVTVLPLKVSFGEDEYLDGKNLSHYEFYEKLIESDSLPKTSQISPFDYEQAFEQAFSEGYDEIICLTIDSALSGCYQSANIARDDNDKIYIVDTLNVAIAERIMVELALRLRDENLSGAEIASKLNQSQPRLKVLAMLDTLEYLKKGGRISSATAFAGELLSIKPVVTVDSAGTVVVCGKARGSKNGNNVLVNLINKFGGIDFNYPYAAAYSGLSDALVNKYLEDSKHLYAHHTDTIPLHSIGCAIGTHLGPGAVGVAFFTKE